MVFKLPPRMFIVPRAPRSGSRRNDAGHRAECRIRSALIARSRSDLSSPRHEANRCDRTNAACYLRWAMSTSSLPFATALRRTLQNGYTAVDFRHDLLAGIVVGIVALPLSMALAIG